MKAAGANPVCRYCGAALDALAPLRGEDMCRSAQCLLQTAHEHTARVKEALRIAAPSAACSQLPHLKKDPAAVVWLQHCEPQMVAVNDDDRDRHRTYLESMVAESIVIDPSLLGRPTADDKHPQSARLCGQCRGRCCMSGAEWRAFIDLTVLQRWQQERPGRSLTDAVDAYISMLPTEHVSDACLYQTETGCAMPRERRADICNDFACEALQQVQRVAQTDPTRAVVAITFHRGYVERAAVVEAGASHALALETPAVPRTSR